MITFQIIIILILLVLSAFFSSSETALTTITPHRLKSLVDEGVKHAEVLEKVLDNKDKMLSVILICNNIVNLTASALATIVVQKLFGSAFVSVGTGILTLLVLIFGEIAPKTMATYRAEKIGLRFAPVINVLMIVFTPIAAAINFLAKGVLFLFGVKKEEHTESYTENEIRSIVEVSHEEGVTTNEEKDIINNVYDFTDTTVKEVMVPKIHVASINIDSDYEEIIKVFKETHFTRLPVYHDDGEEFVGLVNVKDLIDIDPEGFRVRNILRQTGYTYEGKHLSELLVEMKKERTGFMFVLDEYGDTTGIITLEDLLEEIVGDIKDEYDDDEDLEIVKTGENVYEVQGQLSLDDVNEEIGTEFESEDYDSIGGLLIEQLERIPEEGEWAEVQNCILTAKKVDKTKILLVEIKINEKQESIPND
ncbi:MAG: hemolysin family protein [Lachnospiraceae bacterium]|nr:hemolysin family protein [Lachnospiraceae bacterium]